MSCPDLHRLIQDHIDCCLEAGEARLLDAHLAGCAACRDEELRLRELVAGLGRLDEDRDPARDLWPGLRARLEASSAAAPVERAPLPWLRLAAAGLLLGLLVGSQTLFTDAPADDSQALSDEHREVFAEYERASAALIESLESRRDGLSPATLETIDSNLALIEKALTRTREALRSQPDDTDLIQMHYALLGRQTSVLQQLVSMPSAGSMSPDGDR
jgi:anti-sigma factor RsiW